MRATCIAPRFRCWSEQVVTPDSTQWFASRARYAPRRQLYSRGFSPSVAEPSLVSHARDP